jgi:DNA-binding transcriptional LysR family regulator
LIRRIEVSAHGFQALPVLVAGTNRVATLPARLARQLTATLPVRTVRLNFAVPRLVEVLQWHKVRELDPGLQWLRTLITEQAAILPPLAPDAC